MNIMDKIEQVITGGIAIILSLSKLIDWYLKRRKVKLNEKRLKTFIEDTKHSNALSESLTIGKYADRVYTFRAHDSGGIPKLGLPYYTSVVSAYYQNPLRDKSKRYNNIHVDDNYKDIILELLEKDKLEIETVNLKEGLLKDILTDEGVVYGHLYKLAITNSSFFYMSVSWFTDPTDAQVMEADLIANQIQTIYRKHHNNT